MKRYNLKDCQSTEVNGGGGAKGKNGGRGERESLNAHKGQSTRVKQQVWDR